MTGSRLFLVLAALWMALALAACGGGDDAADTVPAAPEVSERDVAIRAAALDHMARSGVLAPGTGAVLLADGQCATGTIWLQSEADAAGTTLAELASSDAAVADASGTLIVEVASTGGDATPADCREVLREALAGFDATQVE